MSVQVKKRTSDQDTSEQKNYEKGIRKVSATSTGHDL